LSSKEADFRAWRMRRLRQSLEERARELLLQTDTPAAPVAEQLGFSSQSHFTHAFRQFTGRTPSEFRRQDRLQ
jgi:AraC-like DNA-binding protein